MIEDGRLRGARGTRVVVRRRSRAGARRAARCRGRRRAPRRGAGRGGRGREGRLPASAGRAARAPSSTRPAEVVEERRREQQVGAQPRMQLRRLAAQRRDADRVLEQAARVGVVPVLRRRQLAQARAQRSVRRRSASTTRRSPAWAISAARNSRKPSSSSLSRLIAGIRAAGSVSGAGSSVRTSSWSLSRKRSTRPRTRIESPSAKRASRSSTSFQTRASMRPLASTSSSARYGAPPFVRSRCLRATA